MGMSTTTGLDVGFAWRAPGRVRRRRAAAPTQADDAAAGLLVASLQPDIERQGALVVHLVGADDGCGTTLIAAAVARAASRHDWCRVLRVDAGPAGAPGRSGPGLLELHRATGSIPSSHEGEAGSAVPLVGSGGLPRPGELRPLYAALRDRFNLVLVDCPPVARMPDSAILSAVADRTILVVRAEHTRAASVSQAARLLAQAGVVRLDAVLTGERRLPSVLDRLL